MSVITHLLAALRLEADLTAWILQIQALDQDDLAVTALGLGLAPFLHYRLEAARIVLPRPTAQAKLAFARRVEEQRHLALRAQLAEVLPRLPTPPIVLKGAYLAEAIYPVAGLRPMNDIDLLFQPSALSAVSAVLQNLGYGAKEKSADLGPGITKHTQTFKKVEAAQATPNPYLSARGQRMIEPHRSLEEAWFGLKCDVTLGMWERSVAWEMAGGSARALKPEDNLLHLSVHLTFHLIMGSPSLVQLLDLALFTQRLAVDWDDFVGRAKVLNASGYAYAALRLAAHTLAAPVPPLVLAQLAVDCPTRVRRMAESLSLTDLMRRTQKPPLRTIRQRLQRGVEDRYETARWAHSTVEWWRVWRSLFDVTRTDTWRQLIGAGR